MTKNFPKKTLVVMEHNWGEEFGADCSVYPFINGANEVWSSEKQQVVSYRQFGDLDDFRLNLDAATEDKDQTYIIYIAAHGNKNSIGSSRLNSILACVGCRAENRNIEGILSGSCLTGNSEENYKFFMQGNALKWAIAYKCSVNWLDGTIIDTKLLEQFLHGKVPKHGKIEDYVCLNVKSALKLFNHQHIIGTDCKEQGMNIEDSLMLTFHEAGRGQRPRSLPVAQFFEEQKSNIEKDFI